MSPTVKFLFGLAATCLMGWAWHGPAGNGAGLIDRLESQAKTAVATTEVPGIEVSLARNPLARVVTLSGPADDLQREGLGSQKGINDYVREVDGIAKVRWADEPETAMMPLLAETQLLIALAYLLGIGMARLFWGRPRRESFLS